MEQIIDDQRGLGVKARIGLVAKEILGIQRDGTGNGHALLHTPGDFSGVFCFSSGQIHTVETHTGTFHAVTIRHIGEHIEREHHILQHRLGVEKGCTLEYHTHLAAQHDFLLLGHAHEVASVIEYLSTGGVEQTNQILDEHGLATATLTDNQVGLAVLKDSGDVFQHFLFAERLAEVFDFNHDRSWVKKTSLQRMSTLELTTASVEALPTFTEPPSTV